MTEYAALHGSNEVAVDRGWVTARAEGAKVSREPANAFVAETATLEWGDEKLTVRSAVDANQRDTTVKTLRAQCDEGEGQVATVLASLARCRTLLFLSTPNGLSPTGHAVAWIRNRQRELDALLVRGERVEGVDGALLLTLPSRDEESAPPTPERVSRRARVLAAVVARSVLERFPPERGHLPKLWDWMDAHSLWGEAELAERELIRTARGQVPVQEVVNGTWRAEGLLVLAWALGVCDLPPHDLPADSQTLSGGVGLFAEKVPPRLAAPTLKSAAELAEVSGRLFGIHWRLRDFTLRPVAMDFGEFASTCWFGPLDLKDTVLVDRDLSIGGVAIASASREAVQLALSAARERHQAINWLRGNARRYSAVGTST